MTNDYVVIVLSRLIFKAKEGENPNILPHIRLDDNGTSSLMTQEEIKEHYLKLVKKYKK